MDSRGIPIVLPGNKYASSPKRKTKTKRRQAAGAAAISELPSSPYNVRSNEPSLLEVYDAFADACFQSHYNHSILNDDYRYNIQDFYKTEMCPSDNFQSSLVPPSTPKRHKLNDSEISSSKVPDLQISRSSMIVCSQQSSQQMEDTQSEMDYMDGGEADSNINSMTVCSSLNTAQNALGVVQIDTPIGETVLPDLDDNYLPHTSTIGSSMDISQQTNTVTSQNIEESTCHQQVDDTFTVDAAKPMVSQEPIEDNMDIMEVHESDLMIPDEVKEVENNHNADTTEDLILLPDIEDNTEAQLDQVPVKDDNVMNDSVKTATTPPPQTTDVLALDELSKCSIEEEVEEITKKPFETETKSTDLSLVSPTEETVKSVEIGPKIPSEIPPESQVEVLQVKAPEESSSNTQINIPTKTSTDTLSDDTVFKKPAAGRRVGRPAKKSTKAKSSEEAPNTPPRRSARNQQQNAEVAPISSPTVRRSARNKPAEPTPESPKRVTRSRAKAGAQSPQATKDTSKASPKKQSVNKNKETAKEEDVDSNKNLEVDQKTKSEMDYFAEYRRTRDIDEIEQINKEFPSLKNYYELVERAGRGTFSKVYKAKDLLADHYMPIDEKYTLDSTDSGYVAIKVIFDISSPKRVADEIECLTMFRSSPCITPLITAFRHEANTYVVLPYIKFDHFDDFYSDMTLSDVRSYISQLLTGLESVHEHSIMHRDVKPGNFLYNNKTKVGYLADFGLAQKMHTSFPSRSAPNPQYTQHQKGGYYTHDRRLPFQANRSGTKGFRAPEIMLKYANQTTAIDIWAVGVILLIILAGKYPFFNPDDDADGIIELAHLFGKKELTTFAEHYERKLFINIPTIPEERCDLADLCRTINKDKVDAWDHKEFILAVDLMDQCLQLIHTKRCTATEALNHPFLKQQQQ